MLIPYTFYSEFMNFTCTYLYSSYLCVCLCVCTCTHTLLQACSYLPVTMFFILISSLKISHNIFWSYLFPPLTISRFIPTFQTMKLCVIIFTTCWVQFVLFTYFWKCGISINDQFTKRCNVFWAKHLVLIIDFLYPDYKFLFLYSSHVPPTALPPRSILLCLLIKAKRLLTNNNNITQNDKNKN